MNVLDRFTEAASDIIGSWVMIGAQTLVIAAWITLNLWHPNAIDDKQFDTLRLVLGLQSVYTAPLILMAQRKVSAKDRKVLHGIDNAERQAAANREKAAERRERMEAKVDALTDVVLKLASERQVKRVRKQG